MKPKVYDITIQIDTHWELTSVIHEIERVIDNFSAAGLITYRVIQAGDAR